MIALLFPAFGPDENGKELFTHADTPVAAHYHRLRESMGAISGGSPEVDAPPRRKGPESACVSPETPHETAELAVQREWFVYGCAVSDAVKEAALPVGAVAGYSMGLYSALYHAGSLSFRDGLDIIDTVYRAVEETVEAGAFLSASVVGLELEDVEMLINRVDGAVHTAVVGRNNRYHHIVAGPRDAVDRLVGEAAAEGALSARILPFSAPYHAPVLRNAAHTVSAFLAGHWQAGLPLGDPAVQVVSSLTGGIISTAAEAAREIESNIDSPFDWEEAMRRLKAVGIRDAYECGPGKALVKAGRFIETGPVVRPLKTLLAEL